MLDEMYVPPEDVERELLYAALGICSETLTTVDSIEKLPSLESSSDETKSYAKAWVSASSKGFFELEEVSLEALADLKKSILDTIDGLVTNLNRSILAFFGDIYAKAHFLAKETDALYVKAQALVRLPSRPVAINGAHRALLGEKGDAIFFEPRSIPQAQLRVAQYNPIKFIDGALRSALNKASEFGDNEGGRIAMYESVIGIFETFFQGVYEEKRILFSDRKWFSLVGNTRSGLYIAGSPRGISSGVGYPALKQNLIIQDPFKLKRELVDSLGRAHTTLNHYQEAKAIGAALENAFRSIQQAEDRGGEKQAKHIVDIYVPAIRAVENMHRYVFQYTAAVVSLCKQYMD
jgi:hypothetical protein